MFHDRYKEMLAPYALSTLDRDDARTLDEHLATCGDCPLELEEWNATAAALAFSAAPAEPSPQVRARIIESVQAESSRSTTNRDRSNERRKEMSTVIPFSQARRFWNATQKFGAIAAILAFVALIISAFVLWKQNRALQTEIASVSAQKDEARRELERQRELLELLSKPAGVAMLSGTREAPKAHATLTYDRQTGKAVLLVEGLPPAPAGKAYQLWFIVGKIPMPGRVFAIDRAGKAILSDQLPSEALKAAVFAVTLEPETGVKAPTGPIYLRTTS